LLKGFSFKKEGFLNVISNYRISINLYKRQKAMSLISVFKIGLWNAWIFMLYIVFYTVFFLRLAKEKDTPSPSEVELSKTKMSLCIFSKLIIVPAVIYSVFLPLKLRTIWFYAGLPITLIGILTGTIVLVNWANTPSGEPVIRGLYIYSRHPMYITTFLFFFGFLIGYDYIYSWSSRF